MIVFKTLRWRNFLSTGNTFTVFAVKNENLTGIDLTDTVYLKKVLRNYLLDMAESSFRFLQGKGAVWPAKP